MTCYKNLIQAIRGELVERVHSGCIVVVDDDENILKSVGTSDSMYFLRSCAKPFQAMPLLLFGAFEKFNLNLKHLAICSASHAGTEKHTQLVKEILEKAGLDETYLKCGTHPPLDTETRHNLIKEGELPNVLHNNCSGKHAGMLLVCAHKNWDINSYLDFEHPLQKYILEITNQYCKTENPPQTIDGCGTPIYGMTLPKIGSGLLRLFLSNEAQELKKAFLTHPDLIGGKGRQDTHIIKGSNNRLIAKVGAEGLLAILNLDLKQALVIKIADSNMNARAKVSIEALKQLGWLTKEDLKPETAHFIDEINETDIKTTSGKIVGQIKPTFSL